MTDLTGDQRSTNKDATRSSQETATVDAMEEDTRELMGNEIKAVRG